MAIASDILTAVKTLVEAEFVSVPLTVHKRRSSEKNPAYFVGMALPCFVVSVNDDRETRMMTATQKFVTYTVSLEYLSVELPGDREPSDAIETILAQLSALFIGPRLTGVSAVSDCDVRPRKPYSFPFASGTANSSGITLTIEAIETAN